MHVLFAIVDFIRKISRKEKFRPFMKVDYIYDCLSFCMLGYNSSDI